MPPTPTSARARRRPHPIASLSPPKPSSFAQPNDNAQKTLQAFFSRSGPAYLFNVARNLAFDPPARRLMQTGEFVVSDVHCKVCGADIGWRYEGAASPEQRYKVGRIVLERAALEVEDGGGEASDDEEVCA